MDDIFIKDTYVDQFNGANVRHNPNYQGVKKPVALVRRYGQQSYDNCYWDFIASPDEVTSTDCVVYGQTPEEMVDALERYLDLPRHSSYLKFVEIQTGSLGPVQVRVLNQPEFKIDRAEDILNHINLVETFGSIYFRLRKRKYWTTENERSFGRILEPKGYAIDGSYNGILVRKNKRLAKQRMENRKNGDKTFRVSDITYALERLERLCRIEGGIRVTSERRIARVLMQRLLLYLAIIDKVYGKNSYRRLVPFQVMIAKWKASKIFSRPLTEEGFEPYRKWLDREATRRKSRGTLIESTNITKSLLEQFNL